MTFFIRASLIFVSKIRGKLQSPKNSFDFQAPECLSGVLQRRFPLKTTNDSISLLQVDRFVTVAQRLWCWYFSGLDIITLCVFPNQVTCMWKTYSLLSIIIKNRRNTETSNFLDFLQTLCHEHSLFLINWCVNMKHIYC